MIRSAPFRLPVALALLTLFWGCEDVGPDVDGLAEEVAQRRQTWEARRPGAYAFELERQCFCAVDARGPVRLTVEGSRVLTRVYSDSGTAVPDAYIDLFPSVDGLFDILEDAIQRAAESVDVTWDPVTGAPSSFFIDYSRSIADEELGFRILSGPS